MISYRIETRAIQRGIAYDLYATNTDGTRTFVRTMSEKVRLAPAQWVREPTHYGDWA